MVQAYLTEGIQDFKRRNKSNPIFLHIKVIEHHNTCVQNRIEVWWLHLFILIHILSSALGDQVNNLKSGSSSSLCSCPLPLFLLSASHTHCYELVCIITMTLYALKERQSIKRNRKKTSEGNRLLLLPVFQVEDNVCGSSTLKITSPPTIRLRGRIETVKCGHLFLFCRQAVPSQLSDSSTTPSTF